MKHGGVKHGGFPKPFDTRNYQGLDSKATTLLVEIDPIGRDASAWVLKNHQLEKTEGIPYTRYDKFVNILLKYRFSKTFRSLQGNCRW